MTETLTRPRSATLAGTAGLVFVATVIVQNVIRGGGPASDAPTSEVIDHFADATGIEGLLVALFALGGLALAVFLGGLWARLDEVPEARSWTRTGIVGAIGLYALFSGVVACEVALVVAADRSEATSTVPTLWILHNTTFAALSLALGIGLLGLSQAAVKAKLIPSVFATIGIVGAACSALGTALAPASADATPAAMLPALVGFLAWLAFVVTAGVRLRRA